MREGEREKESLDFLIVYRYVYVLACLYDYHVCVCEHMVSRRGHKIPWNWNCR